MSFTGLNYTTGIQDAPVQYSDGTPFNKSVQFAFDDNSEKFGSKECNYMKKGVQFKPRDTDCSSQMAPICVWNSEFAKMLTSQNFFFIGPTCPTDFELNVREEDGRSCYGVIAETSTSMSSEALQVFFLKTKKIGKMNFFL